jgi:uncharacterized protein YndB with AHSA1/START domain
MTRSLTARAGITIRADAGKVWSALTDPAQIRKYLFGTETVTDWKVGSPIFFRGEWEGRRYEDKGEILRVVPGRVLEYTYWSGMSGKEDRPENYSKVTFDLSPAEGGTRLSVTQDNAGDEKSRDHSEKNWSSVLETMKKLLETP